MNDKDLVELLKYSSPYTILVVTWENKLLELHCPFKILVKQNIGGLKVGENASVTMVKLSTNLITVFVIDDKAYFFYYFDIMI